MLLRPAILAAILSLGLGATEPSPGTYQATQEGHAIYLTLDGQRAALQDAEGQVVGAFRLLRDGESIVCYRSGTATGAQVEVVPGGLAVVAGRERTTFAPCPAPPEAVGWQPYALPPPEADAAKRRAVADELRRRFDLEQRLRREAIPLAGGRMDGATMQRPEVAAAWQAINRTDADNQAWLLRTLRSSGWIGSRSHGAQAHEAILLIMLHNIGHLRLAATALAQMQAEAQRHEIGEMSVANLADRFALILGEPMAYGIQGGIGSDGQTIIPIIADAVQVDANRKRIGQPPLATMAARMRAKVLRIAADGRLVGEGAAPVVGLDALDQERARSDAAWGLAEAGKADPALGKAIAAARAGDGAALTAWVKQAEPGHRDLVAGILEALGRVPPGGDAEAAVVAQRTLLDAYLAGAPATDDGRILVGNLLAYSLVARAAAPAAGELARAAALVQELEGALERCAEGHSPLAHALADTIACFRFRQGRLADAAELWRRALALAGTPAPALYQRRLAVAVAGDATAALPRD